MLDNGDPLSLGPRLLGFWMLDFSLLLPLVLDADGVDSGYGMMLL